ncbi:Tyrosinase P like protein [Verticillium longisporum]|nr:Tyrosinase P like protein [Verticillium longisporum]
MRFLSILTSVALTSVALATPVVHPRGDASDEAQVSGLIENIKASVLKSLDEREAKLRKRGEEASCHGRNVVFRREYGSLSEEERLSYINAIKCLQTLPPRTPANVSSGAKSRYDDFVVTHIQQTLTIHYTGCFMPWHRWLLYEYETALRDECNYTGYLPYWDWPRYASAPEKSPIFNGDPYSLGGNGDLGGNGEYVPHEGPVIVPPPGVGGGNISLPAGLGGGFVTTGPFANMTVNLGPVGGLQGTAPGPDGGLGYNPRGLKRDVGPAMNLRYANYTTVLNLLQKPNIEQYRLLSEGVPYTIEIGPHGGIHYTISGDPGGDLFTSPGDPAFYTHHAMMDRMWTLWQGLDPKSRHCQLNGGNYGHKTWANQPPSEKTRLSDMIDMGYAGDKIMIAEVMDTLSGPFCYFYL